MQDKKITVPKILEKKLSGDKIVALTAYDYVFATLVDSAGVDIVLVGDSAAMVFSGHETTLPLTMDEALYHCRAVRRGTSRALLVADMPFLSFQSGADDAVRNAGQFFKQAQVDAVKLEGGEPVAETVRRLVDSGMPVMGHLGLTPQSIRAFGGYAVQAKAPAQAEKLLKDAQILQDAGIFSLVVEKIPAEVAKKVTEKLKVPVIGIGAGPYCDGQVLVTYDILGLFEKFQPKFVRRYAELGRDITDACRKYADDVRNGRFPDMNESF